MLGNLQNLSWFNIGKIKSSWRRKGVWSEFSFQSSLTNCSKLELQAFDDKRFGGNFPNIIHNIQMIFTHTPVVGTNDIRVSMHPWRDSIPFPLNISFSFGELHVSLQSLGISLNKLNNTIPINLFSVLSLLELLNLSHNSFSRTLPEEIGNFTNLVAFDVSNNKFSSNIPSEIGNCLALEELYIESNFF